MRINFYSTTRQPHRSKLHVDNKEIPLKVLFLSNENYPKLKQTAKALEFDTINTAKEGLLFSEGGKRIYSIRRMEYF
jgi:hypothetical protein